MRWQTLGFQGILESHLDIVEFRQVVSSGLYALYEDILWYVLINGWHGQVCCSELKLDLCGKVPLAWALQAYCIEEALTNAASGSQAPEQAS